MSDKYKELSQEELVALLGERDTHIGTLNQECAARRVTAKEHDDAEAARVAKGQTTDQRLATENAKVVAERDALKSKLEQSDADRDALTIRTAIAVEAGKLGFANPEDAWTLLDTSKVEIAEDGTVKGFEKPLEELAKSGRLPMQGAQGDGPGTVTVHQVKTPNLRPGVVTDDGRLVAKVAW